LPVIVSNRSNNYGPYQFSEKLIPLMILNALEGKPLPVYGDGSNVRDWLYVEDHAKALSLILENGQLSETYNVGGRNQRTNLEVVKGICSALDQLNPDGVPHARYITSIAHGGEFHHRDAEDTKLKEGRKVGASEFGNPLDRSFRPTQRFPRLGALEDFKRSSSMGLNKNGGTSSTRREFHHRRSEG
jgi:hypothetical protein